MDTRQFEDFLGTLKYPPNTFQRAILEEIAHERGMHIVVSALAGSGKTSLIVMLAGLFNRMGSPSATFLAFNVKIKDELNERLPSPYRAINSHALGLQVLKGRQLKSRVDCKKWPGICKGLLEHRVERGQLYNRSRALEKLTSKVMLNNVDPADFAAVAEIGQRYRIWNGDDPDTLLISQVVPALELAESIWNTTGMISFDEMLYLPVKLKLSPPKFQYVLVDEAQDLNVLQQEIAFASLAAGGRYIFVGDERQAMYAFAGADAASFRRITERTNATVYPLNICYRCPRSHIELAQQIVPQIEAAPKAEDGIIEYAKEEELPQRVKPGVMVMCRLNAPLISAYFSLIARQIPAKVMGKDIGRDLTATLDKVADFDGFRYERMIEYLEVYRAQQLFNLAQKEANESQVELLNDKVDCLIVCVENFTGVKSLDGLKDVLMDLFGDDDKDDWKRVVALCTVHKAKGLEADETFILRPEKMPLTWPGQRPDEMVQERNILYVALTRAKKSMTFLTAQPEALQSRFSSPASAPVVSDEPDGTCRYMIENQRGIPSGADWLTWKPAPKLVQHALFEVKPVAIPARNRILALVEGLSRSQIDEVISVLNEAKAKV